MTKKTGQYTYISSCNKEVYKIGILRVVPFFCLFVILIGCYQNQDQNTHQEHPNTRKLKAHSEEFNPDIILLGENIHMAVGYDGSNASMIIGEDGVIIVDALRSLGAAEKVAEKFRKITNKPVKAFIYTHGHGDHTGGASAFVGENKDVKIIARNGFKEELQESSPVEPILKKRNTRQFGRDLPVDEIINRGIAPGITPKDRVGKGYIEPNIMFDDSLFVSISGVYIQLYAVNGETNDHLFIWCPNEKLLFTGDNYYKAFPNLYAIRGSRYRDVKSWGESVRKMSTFPAEFLIPGHTRPIYGTELVHRSLHNYSEAILSIYEQTIKAMNKGYTLEETVESVKLPDSLRIEPNLQEFYGSVNWGVRSIFLHYVGWFDGNPTNLNPLSPQKKAEHVLELAGGKKKLLKQLKATLDEGHYQWGLQLADYLLQTGYKQKDVTALKVIALRGLAAQQLNAPARNYYLSCAQELESTI